MPSSSAGPMINETSFQNSAIISLIMPTSQLSFKLNECSLLWIYQIQMKEMLNLR
jgi:hypothetical protein